MSIFRYLHFLYVIFVMVIIYLQINLKLKLHLMCPGVSIVIKIVLLL
jgi:hypothetical protein